MFLCFFAYIFAYLVSLAVTFVYKNLVTTCTFAGMLKQCKNIRIKLCRSRVLSQIHSPLRLQETLAL